MRTSTTDARPRPGLRAADGFTLVEVGVAMLVLFLALFGLMAAFEGSVRGSHTAERESAAAAIAERHLEQLLARPYAELANCTASGTAPTPAGTTTADPRVHITGTAPPRLMIRRSPRSDTDTSLVPGTPVAGEPFVLNPDAACVVSGRDGTGVVAGPLPVTALSGDRLFGAKVYRFVTWADEPGCLLNQAEAVNGILSGVVSLANELLTSLRGTLDANLTAFCGRTQDAKRLTVAVVLPRVGNTAGIKKPLYLSTLVPDPDAGTGIAG